MADQIPLVDYLMLGDEPHLVANECTGCGARYFDRRNAWVEGFLRVLCLNPPVTVAQLFEVSASLAEKAASDLAERFETVVVWERWVGVHGSISSNSSSVINCGVCRPSV